MRLKLNCDKAEGLYRIMTHLLENYQPENMAESLVEDLVKKVYEKLRKKVISSYVKEYTLILTPEEAKAYWIFFNQNSIDQGFTYEKNIVQNHCLLIDQIYG